MLHVETLKSGKFFNPFAGKGQIKAKAILKTYQFYLKISILHSRPKPTKGCSADWRRSRRRSSLLHYWSIL